MDSIDEIEAKNNRNLETAELVSAYMRANAQRAAQRAAQQLHSPEVTAEEAPKEPEGDKLDFSSEFSTGDMGLSSQGGAGELLAWKQQVESEEDDQNDEDEDKDSEDEHAQEWQSGGWQDKDDEPQSDDQQTPEEPEDDALAPEPAVSSTSSPPDTSVEPKPSAPPNTPTSQSLPPAAPKAQETAAAIEKAQQFWGGDRPSQPAAVSDSPSLETFATEPALPRARPAPQVALPTVGRAADVDPTLAQLARKLVVSPAEEPGYEECVRLLARFGAGALRVCSREKVRVEILDENDFLKHEHIQALGLRPEDTPSDGAYLVESRHVLIERRCLTGRPRFFHPALYYFAHAFDHAQGGESFSSRKALAVVACFEASTRAQGGFDFVDELAAADPVRYFARSVAVYLGQDDCSDPLWSHQDLYDFDRPMYDYLQYLFARLGS